jgi:hypothetical protein
MKIRGVKHRLTRLFSFINLYDNLNFLVKFETRCKSFSYFLVTASLKSKFLLIFIVIQVYIHLYYSSFGLILLVIRY